MAKSNSVNCIVHGFQQWAKPKSIRFDIGKNLWFSTDGLMGPSGISTTAADLLDLASTVFQIERLIYGRGRINRPVHFELSMKLRKPSAWSAKAIQTVESILYFLGNATWEIKLYPGLDAKPPECTRDKDHRVKQIVLFSGGMDSTCGAITLSHELKQTQLVSFYSTHQKQVQVDIASELGFRSPTQWRLHWNRNVRPGGTFYYRSFLFLSIAAAVATSWDVQKIYQFENGILATAVPPGPSWMMTKHAHPKLHYLAEELFSELFGKEWYISNPFLLCTKRDCYEKAVKVLGARKTNSLLDRTETCWFQWSNRIPGGKKKPGHPCGVCVPCLIRRTARPQGNYEFDLVGDTKFRGDENHGFAFQSYFEFCNRILNARDEYGFYRMFSDSFELVEGFSTVTLQQLYHLFQTFAKEFMSTYHLKRVRDDGYS